MPPTDNTTQIPKTEEPKEKTNINVLAVVFGLVIVVVLASSGLYFFYFSQTNTDEVEEKVEIIPVYIVDISTNSNFSVQVFVNDAKVGGAKPPDSLYSSATINEYLKEGSNTLTVSYELSSLPKTPPDFGPRTFSVILKKQNDRLDPKTSSEVLSIDGPVDLSLIEEMGVFKKTFIVEKLSSEAKKMEAEESSEFEPIPINSVSDSDKQSIISILTDLHRAYSDRSQERIEEITSIRNKMASESYGLSYDSFLKFERDYNKQIFENSTWEMEPLKVGDNISFSLSQNKVTVLGKDPIIESTKAEIEGGFLVVEYSSFAFQKTKNGWVLVALGDLAK